MNAEPLIRKIVRAANAARLEVIVIGNAGAALNGAPVTTVDFDFFVRDIEGSMDKIRALAKHLSAVVVLAASPLSRTVRVENEKDNLYIDIIDCPAGLPSFAGVRKRSMELEFGRGHSCVHVASLDDIIRSKKALGRPKDNAVLPLLELTLDEQRKQQETGIQPRP